MQFLEEKFSYSFASRVLVERVGSPGFNPHFVFLIISRSLFLDPGDGNRMFSFSVD